MIKLIEAIENLENYTEDLVLNTNLVDESFYDMEKYDSDRNSYIIKVKIRGKEYNWVVGEYPEGALKKAADGPLYVDMGYNPTFSEEKFLDRLFNTDAYSLYKRPRTIENRSLRADEENILARYLLDNKEKFM